MRFALLASLMFSTVVLLLSCNTPTTPTPVPTSTPATPQERVERYDMSLRYGFSMMLKHSTEIEDRRYSDPMVPFLKGMSVGIELITLSRLKPPEKVDFQATGGKWENIDSGLHYYVLSRVDPCWDVNEIAMNFEVYSVQELLDANAICYRQLLQLRNEMPGLFECPKEMPLCRD